MKWDVFPGIRCKRLLRRSHQRLQPSQHRNMLVEGAYFWRCSRCHEWKYLQGIRALVSLLASGPPLDDAYTETVDLLQMRCLSV